MLPLWRHFGNPKLSPCFFSESLTKWHGEKLSTRRVLVKAEGPEDPDWIDFYREGNLFIGYEYFADYCRRPVEVENEAAKNVYLRRTKADDKVIHVELGQFVMIWPSFETVKKLARPYRQEFRRPSDRQHVCHMQPY
jgi:hypothetical protein